MRCEYLGFNGLCRAQLPNAISDSRPNAEIRKKYCENEVENCPRWREYVDFQNKHPDTRTTTKPDRATITSEEYKKMKLAK